MPKPRRRGALEDAAPTVGSMRRLYFVGESNAVVSVMAALWAAAMTPKGWETASGGVHPAAAVHPLAQEALTELGLDADDLSPKPLDPDWIASADVLVTVTDAWGVPPDRVGRPSYRWVILDPSRDPSTAQELKAFRACRDRVRYHVERLVAEPPFAP